MKFSIKKIFIGTVVLGSLYESVEGCLLFGKTGTTTCDICEFNRKDVERVINDEKEDIIRDIESERDRIISEIRYQRKNQNRNNHHHH